MVFFWCLCFCRSLPNMHVRSALSHMAKQDSSYFFPPLSVYFVQVRETRSYVSFGQLCITIAIFFLCRNRESRLIPANGVHNQEMREKKSLKCRSFRLPQEQDKVGKEKSKQSNDDSYLCIFQTSKWKSFFIKPPRNLCKLS